MKAPGLTFSYRTAPPGPLDFVLLPLLYYASAKLGVMLTVMPEGMAILWPPNGVLLAYFIRFGRAGYLPFGALALVAEVILDVPRYPLMDALMFGLANVAEAAIASLLLERAQFNPRFAHVSDLTKFVVAAPVTAASLGSVIGALTAVTLPEAGTTYFQFLRIWWFGDALGLMIVTPLLLGVWQHDRHTAPSWRPMRISDGVVAIAAAVMFALLLAAREGMLMGTHVGPVLLLPFAVFAGVRFGPSAGALTVSGIAVFILVLTTRGRNPFGADEPRAAVIHAQEFVFVLGVMTLGLAALMSHVRRTQQALESANDELRVRADVLGATNHELRAARAEVVALNEALEARVHERTRELEEALSHVKQLHGLLPICAWCKRVRDDHDYWHSVEEYISARTDAQFSHGICPDCAAEVTRTAVSADDGRTE